MDDKYLGASGSRPFPDPVPEPAECRLVSYNVLYEGVAPDGHGWSERSAAVIAELRRLSPDIIAFQEAWKNQYAELRELLPAFSWVAATDTPAHTPIAYRSDQFDLASSGTFWLSPPEADPGTPAWDAMYQRLATYATLDDLDTDRSLTVMNVHLDHEGDRARREGVALARDRLADLATGSEIALAGDFNCQPGDRAYDRATTDHEGWPSLSDAGTVAEQTAGPTETYTGFPGEDYQPENIDHVFVSDGVAVDRVLTCLPATSPDQRPSDHRPVLADLSY
ncbi:endonuclease/exonuclease/phosphatase family protein [Halovenus sp. HT40]|uniref:endonuclease/exonuclease/phosphatase family protein n=1 Tax=Halovenus sp. HT40 TaxID=3126691 RepID=UPI00300E8812